MIIYYFLFSTCQFLKYRTVIIMSVRQLEEVFFAKKLVTLLRWRLDTKF